MGLTLRELDRLIGIHVMGWKPVPGWVDGYEDPSGSTKALDYNHFTQDITLAWEVVERLVSRGYHVDLHITKDRTEVAIATVEIVLLPDVNGVRQMAEETTPFADVAHESMPLAICLAALASVGITVNQTEVSDASRT
jgi:hypothetical protein